MDPEQFYRWMDKLLRQFPKLGKWQVLGLTLFSLGVVLAEHCQLTRVAEHLSMWGKPDSVERRLQRWLSNKRWDMQTWSADWVRWVWQKYGQERRIVLVDETKLSDHLGVMMVGLAYQGRCIPLLWRCYVANSQADYPSEGQVGIIMGLLNQLKTALPADAKIFVQADRGIGNSNRLMRQIEQGGMWFMFRVKQRSVFRTRRNAKYAQPLSTLIKPGETWSGRGWIFKASKMLPVQVHLAWKTGQSEPWCLVTNAPNLTAQVYALRMWQEEGFRDLKSFGWRWDTSHVWQPEHAHRLLLVLALAYAWVISQEVLLRQSPTAVQRLVERGTRPRFSVFRRALRYIRQALELHLPLLFDLRFIPSFAYV